MRSNPLMQSSMVNCIIIIKLYKYSACQCTFFFWNIDLCLYHELTMSQNFFLKKKKLFLWTHYTKWYIHAHFISWIQLSFDMQKGKPNNVTCLCAYVYVHSVYSSGEQIVHSIRGFCVYDFGSSGSFPPSIVDMLVMSKCMYWGSVLK